MGERTKKESEEAKEDNFEFHYPPRPLRPSQCNRYMRRTLAEHLPAILHGLVEGARKGNCQHVKLATELLRVSEEPTQTREKGPVAKLLEEFEDSGGTLI